jgi:hypothetical protein
MSVDHNYIMINYIWLHVSTFKKSSSGHLNLLLWPTFSTYEMLARYVLLHYHLNKTYLVTEHVCHIQHQKDCVVCCTICTESSLVCSSVLKWLSHVVLPSCYDISSIFSRSHEVFKFISIILRHRFEKQLDNVEHLNCLGSLINDARCTCES